MDLKIIRESAQKKFDAKEYDSCLLLLEPHMSADNISTKEHKLYAEALFAKKDFAGALPSFQHNLRALGIKCGYSFFQKARTAVRKANLPKNEQKKFWESCANPKSKDFIDSMQELFERNYTLAEKKLECGLKEIYQDDEIIGIWKESFLYLKTAMLGSDIHIEQPATIQKIIVSGMGWSGSSAFYDYFLEFDEISSLQGEMPFIESVYGLKNIFNSVGDTTQFINSCILFFYYSMLGHGKIQSAEIFKSFRKTAKRIKELGPLVYAQKSRQVAKRIARCINLTGKNNSILCELSNLSTEVINQFATTDQSARFILLDNDIHISAITLIKYIPDSYVLCSFRDPRSQYVALTREFPGFSQTCDEFIESIAEKRKQADVDIEKTNQVLLESGSTSRIQKIEFEEFVLSERYRDDLARSIGLDISKRKKHSHFKPWESMRNICIHQEHLITEDIKKIETALRDYCREPSVIKLPPKEL